MQTVIFKCSNSVVKIFTKGEGLNYSRQYLNILHLYNYCIYTHIYIFKQKKSVPKYQFKIFVNHNIC